MPRKPKKLIHWLIEVLDKETFCDLEMKWEDRVEMKFWLPWPRQMNKGWQEKNSIIFFEYVKMQKGYKEGDNKDYVKWKARFRTALNKDPCITELKSEHTKGKKLYQIDMSKVRLLSESESSCSTSESGSGTESSTPNSPSCSELSGSSDKSEFDSSWESSNHMFQLKPDYGYAFPFDVPTTLTNEDFNENFEAIKDELISGVFSKDAMNEYIA